MTRSYDASYDDQNIFAKILRGEIPCDKIDECAHTLSFYDIQPQAQIHALLIPKNAYISMTEFSRHASAIEQTAFFDALGRLIQKLELDDKGYRIMSNAGAHGHQEVPHMHLHILGGEPLGALLNLRDKKAP